MFGGSNVKSSNEAVYYPQVFNNEILPNLYSANDNEVGNEGGHRSKKATYASMNHRAHQT